MARLLRWAFMDFSKAEFEATAAPACVACRTALASQYWTAAGATLCEPCARTLEAPPAGGGWLRFLKAFVVGTGAGLVGAIGYGLVIHYAKVEMALITIFIGWLVGRGVRWGSEGRGGRVYQVLGALLTYVWCMMAYVPDLVEELTRKEETNVVVATIMAPILALIIPFTGGMGVLGTLILGFGVWRGWSEPARAPIVIEGPFGLATAAPAAPLVDAPPAAEPPAPQ